MNKLSNDLLLLFGSNNAAPCVVYMLLMSSHNKKMCKDFHWSKISKIFAKWNRTLKFIILTSGSHWNKGEQKGQNIWMSNRSACSSSIEFLIYRLSNYGLNKVSISSTFYAQIFCTNFSPKPKCSKKKLPKRRSYEKFARW